MSDRTFPFSGLDLEHARSIAGRSLTRSKAPGKLFDIGAGPLYACGGSGAFLTDVDGHRYIDMICALGAISLGYGAVSERAVEQVQRGWIYSLPSPLEGQAASLLIELCAPWASSIRFVKTGSEATHAAYRIAKAVRKQTIESATRVFIGDWAYHGWHEWTEYATKIPHGCDLNAFQASLQARHVFDPVPFAVFIEPHRWEPVDVTWLQHVRDFCTRVGALLVFDNMIYGGRWALGGATEYFGVTPDLATFGKAIGNGAPIACVVGNAALAEHGELISGTYSGDAAALAAVMATLQVYRTHPVIETLWARGRQLARGLREAVALYPGEVHLEGAAVHQRLRFGDPQEGRRFAALMAQRGILWHPDVVNIMYAHTEAHIERVVEAAMASLAELARTVPA